MFETYFSLNQITPLIISGYILILSILFFFKKKENIALPLLFLGAIGIGYFASNLNDFLGIWDEQFHALVAKNMTNEPLHPKLFPETILPYQYENWTTNYTWLHKQPLYLWQMALSIKLFGITELAVRIPSILLHAIIPLFIYRIGKITISKEVGFIAAVLITVSYFPLELISGGYSTDHNDISFLFYVTGSFWSWFEYYSSKKIKYLVLIGLFSGCAVLVKWLMGMIIYIIWFIINLISYGLYFFKKKHILPIIISFSISLLIFMPWQIYIHFNFPKEAYYELILNSRHFFEAIEGHSGNFSFHFTTGLSKLYGSGDAIPFLLLIGLILAIKKCNNIKNQLFIGVAVSFIYLFYSFSATKMIAFTIIAMPFIYLGLATLIYFTINFIASKIEKQIFYSIAAPLLTIIIAFTAINFKRLENYHTNWKPKDNNNWTIKTKEKELILNINKDLKEDQYVIFNCNINPFTNIPIMFYTNHLAYLQIPSKQEIKTVKNTNKKIAIFDSGNLPKYIFEDSSIKKIKINNN